MSDEQGQEPTDQSQASLNTGLSDSLEYICITCADEVRRDLQLDEYDYQMLRRTFNNRNKRFYIYGVLDELERVATGMMTLKELIESPSDQPSDSIVIRIQRNLFESINSIESMYERRLIELLVDLICFCEISQEIHITHYLLHKEYEEFKKYTRSQKEYYDLESKNAKFLGDLLVQWLQKVESDPTFSWSKCWYLELKNGAISKGPGRDKMSSFEQRYKTALRYAKRNESLTLGLTYDDSFGQPSRDIHLNIGGTNSAISHTQIQSRPARLAMLAGLCVVRCQKLLHRKKKRQGLVGKLTRQLYSQNVLRGSFDQIRGKGIRIGDFAIVQGDICEVIASKKSSHGYKSFQIRFLDDNHPAKEDWFRAANLTKFSRRSELARKVTALLSSHGAIPPSRKTVARIARQQVLDFWNRGGAKEMFFGQHEKAQEKLERFIKEMPSEQ
jgi:hypothetical protein